MPEIIVSGIPVSEGIAIGSPFFVHSEETKVLRVPITENEIEDEIKKYHQALDKSRNDLLLLQKELKKNADHEVIDILYTHIAMLEDPLMLQSVEEGIRCNKKNSEKALLDFVDSYKNRFQKDCPENLVFQERMKDVGDVYQRILRNLHLNQDSITVHQPNFGDILIATEISPSYAAEAQLVHPGAFVTQTGGETSHAAIIAKAAGIPYVAKVDVELIEKQKIEMLIVDALQGKVILNPQLKTIQAYSRYQKKIHTYQKGLLDKKNLSSSTKDGKKIEIYANISSLEDLALLQDKNAAGIGLVRSEYLFFDEKEDFPTEEKQYGVYKKLAQAAKDFPLTIRLFDIGGDKSHIFSYLTKIQNEIFASNYHEMNPVLGARAIRFLLKNREVLRRQIRALLRARVYGNIQILLPLVTDIVEVMQIKECIAQEKEKLSQEGRTIPPVALGCMVEVPSIAIISDILAKEVDFLSVGTNDLTQYLLAADRTNPYTSHLYFPAHLSVLRLLRWVIRSARREKKPLMLCGEIAANVQFLPLLLGMGIERFSVAPRHIPQLQESIRSISLFDAREVMKKAFSLPDVTKLQSFLMS
ncbi:MAG: phosphoenolpyruvate--protein phosphotransferase [Parachlamydiales bacterium]|nr:phosphoenolpyruvate--protein phosphotransferase [Parachlamydiales bacterium]